VEGSEESREPSQEFPDVLPPPGDLKEQAESLRERPSEQLRKYYANPLPGWRKLFYLAAILAVLALVVFLLVAQDSRRQLAATIAGGLSGIEEEEIFRLPPPPPLRCALRNRPHPCPKSSQRKSHRAFSS
jgi:hypothetical protein